MFSKILLPPRAQLCIRYCSNKQQPGPRDPVEPAWVSITYNKETQGGTNQDLHDLNGCTSTVTLTTVPASVTQILLFATQIHFKQDVSCSLYHTHRNPKVKLPASDPDVCFFFFFFFLRFLTTFVACFSRFCFSPPPDPLEEQEEQEQEEVSRGAGRFMDPSLSNNS